MVELTAGKLVARRPDLDRGMSVAGLATYGGLLVVGLIFTAYSLYRDISGAGSPPLTFLPFLLLGLALLIALGFEFVNGFHDTANAVATVIYTHSLAPTSPSSGRGSGTSSAFCSPPAPSPSASLRSCRSS